MSEGLGAGIGAVSCGPAVTARWTGRRTLRRQPSQRLSMASLRASAACRRGRIRCVGGGMGEQIGVPGCRLMGLVQAG